MSRASGNNGNWPSVVRSSILGLGVIVLVAIGKMPWEPGAACLMALAGAVALGSRGNGK